MERREQLIDHILDTQPRLAGFVRTLPSDMIAGSWDMLSYSYQRGFEAMWDQAFADHSGLLLRPLLSLWRQSVELALKASISEIGGGLDHKLGHDLKKLFAQLLKERAALGHTDDDDLARDVTAMIDLVQSFDPFADRFRYPTAREGRCSKGSTSTSKNCSRHIGSSLTGAKARQSRFRELRGGC